MQPLPAQRSTISALQLANLRATSTNVSVSDLGIKTPFPTFIGIP